MTPTPDNEEPARKRARTSSSNCRVFKDMLASGTPSAGEVYEGIDVVRLTDDAEDLRLLLTPMYYRSEGPMHSVYLVAQLKRLLDMARKYMADVIQKETIDHLKALFPSTLEAARRSSSTLCPPGQTFDPWVAVEIYLEHNIPIILPLALYYTAQRCDLSGVLALGLSTAATRLALLFREAYAKALHEITIDGSDFFEAISPCTGPDLNVPDCTGVSDVMQRESLERHRSFAHDIFRKTDVDSHFLWYEDLCGPCINLCSERQRLLAGWLWSRLPRCCEGLEWLAWYHVFEAEQKVEAARVKDQE